jgi:hypothetical protein
LLLGRTNFLSGIAAVRGRQHEGGGDEAAGRWIGGKWRDIGEDAAGSVKKRREIAVTQHTTACCSMQVVDITLVEQPSTNITSLRMVQQKHCGPKNKLNFILLQTKAR